MSSAQQANSSRNSTRSRVIGSWWGLMARTPRSPPLSGQFVRLTSPTPHLRLLRLGVGYQFRMVGCP